MFKLKQMGLLLFSALILMGSSPIMVSADSRCTNLTGAEQTQCAREEANCTDTAINQDNCGIIAYLVKFINFLSVLVGVVVVIMVAVGGIQYSASRDNPQEAAAAKTRIRNAILALVFYLFIYAFLQWLVPGGLF